MLPKSQKLSLSADVRKSIQGQGLRWRGNVLEAVYDFRTSKPQTAVIIPKAAIAKASDRNAVKRCIFSEVQIFHREKIFSRLIIRVRRFKSGDSENQRVRKELVDLFAQVRKDSQETTTQ